MESLHRFADGHAPATEEQWRQAVEQSLKGRSVDSLTSTSLDGIRIAPLYTAAAVAVADEAPGVGTFIRGTVTARRDGVWDIRARINVDSDAEANRAVLDELGSGSTSVELVFGDHNSDLNVLLDGVLGDLADIAFNGGLPAALLERWQSTGAPANWRGCLGFDPLNGSWEEIAAAVAQLREAPRATAIRANAERFAWSGASPGQQLAAAIAMAVEALRQLEARGVAPGDAARAMRFTLAADAEMFSTVAMVRALRWMWSTVLDSVGVQPDPAHFNVEVVPNAAMMSLVDPWVNVLRVTSAVTGAVIGGADTVTVDAFLNPDGTSAEFGTRMARNLQLMLAEESHLGAVVDPAGGSYFIEALTNDLGGVAWKLFQQMESAGGFSEGMNLLQSEIDSVVQQRAAAAATRKRPLTGVSEFPDIDEVLPARNGTPDGVYRPTAPFEELRYSAGRLSNPTVFSANLGPIAVHTARATFAKNFFEAGGIRAVPFDGTTEPADLAQAFTDSGSRIAVLCSSDGMYADLGPAAAQALKSAGAEYVYLAGRPGESEAALREAGVDEFISMGSDLIAILSHTHTLLGGSE